MLIVQLIVNEIIPGSSDGELHGPDSVMYMAEVESCVLMEEKEYLFGP